MFLKLFAVSLCEIMSGGGGVGVEEEADWGLNQSNAQLMFLWFRNGIRNVLRGKELLKGSLCFSVSPSAFQRQMGFVISASADLHLVRSATSCRHGRGHRILSALSPGSLCNLLNLDLHKRSVHYLYLQSFWI